jgi:hypothetical protein
MDKLDWKHLAIFALFIAAAVVMALVPKAAAYVSPLLPVLGALALGKQWAPADKDEDTKP